VRIDAGPELSVEHSTEGALVVRLAGAWRLAGGIPSAEPVERELTGPTTPHAVDFDTRDLREWDTSLLTFVTRVTALCRERGVEADRAGLPAGVQRLLTLAEAVPEKEDARGAAGAAPWVTRVGATAQAAWGELLENVAFLGEIARAFGRLLTGRARYRRSDLLVFIQQVGAEALGIVTLISFLVGLILAFVGAVQLEQFGATIYVADLVGIAMVREMGAMMTGIVMAGRTGASYAAQLGSMKVNQEIDALTTMGIDPLDFLVLPRVIALCLMMPLLCLYADAMGILGGAAVGIGMLDLSATTYFDETFAAVSLSNLVGGVVKATTYGMLIAAAGCLRGMQSGASSSAVGDATTSAVVTGIVLIIVTCGIYAVVFYLLGI
jgi:phospholipid/cholesterol/gamma-HCH transport system permease protein